MKIAALLTLVMALTVGFVLSSNVATAGDGPFDPFDEFHGQETSGEVEGSCSKRKAMQKGVTWAKKEAERKAEEQYKNCPTAIWETRTKTWPEDSINYYCKITFIYIK